MAVESTSNFVIDTQKRKSFPELASMCGEDFAQKYGWHPSQNNGSQETNQSTWRDAMKYILACAKTNERNTCG